ncbi:hypothetical protein [Kineothrix sedimenti]|uniref:Uncharacterized protein n=1 Tax=Kineothrix sedimenti TaxID=3123317 RepID=A0ABZ3EVZ3_9FIRM
MKTLARKEEEGRRFQAILCYVAETIHWLGAVSGIIRARNFFPPLLSPHNPFFQSLPNPKIIHLFKNLLSVINAIWVIYLDQLI